MQLSRECLLCSYGKWSTHSQRKSLRVKKSHYILFNQAYTFEYRSSCHVALINIPENYFLKYIFESFTLSYMLEVIMPSRGLHFTCIFIYMIQTSHMLWLFEILSSVETAHLGAQYRLVKNYS